MCRSSAATFPCHAATTRRARACDHLAWPLPTVRTESARLAEIAVRERRTHLAYLAEVLTAEFDDRSERRRTRRINDAKFLRLKRLADFNVDAVPTIQPATLGQLAAGHYLDAGEPIVLLGDSGTE
jgi:hypothetical protein